MSKNDYRAGKRQVSFVVDSDLMDTLRGKARRHGKTVTAYLTDLILKDLDREPQPAPTPNPVTAVPRATPDWDAILAGGLAKKSGGGGDTVRDVASQSEPWEDIA